jgi:hypothetical protein
VEQYDSLNPGFVERQIGLAQGYGIDGFLSNTGGAGNLTLQLETAIAAAEGKPQPFRLAALYDWYYRLPAFFLMQEKPDYTMAADLLYYTNSYGSGSRWLRYGSRPVVTAPFLSNLIAPEKWKRVGEIAANPSLSSFDGTLDPGTIQPGFGNRIAFQFARAEKPATGDPRYLSVAFDYLAFLDRNLKEIARLDIGTVAARPHLLTGWSVDEIMGQGDTMVWAEGTQRQASLEVEIPPEARFCTLRCLSFPSDNSVTMKINEGASFSFVVPTTSAGTYTFRIGSGEAPDSTERPFALFLDTKGLESYFEGYMSYIPYSTDTGCMVSDPSPVIRTVQSGYDDRKIRYPGSYVDREDGAFYRRQWESVLAAKPDVVTITSWNEWAEGTNIEPTVEFGYKYLELTLTYALIHRGDLAVSVSPSSIDLTVTRYRLNLNGESDIRFHSAGSATLVFKNLPPDLLSRCVVYRNGQPFQSISVNLAEGTLTLQAAAGGGDFRLAFPNQPATRLFIPFYQEDPGSFMGLAVSNYSLHSAQLQFVAGGGNGKALEFPSNPRTLPLAPDNQLAMLGYQIFGGDGMSARSGWLELTSDNAGVASFFLFGSGNQMDGSVALAAQTKRMYFTRVYEGRGALRGQDATTLLSLANPNYSPIAVRMSYFSPAQGSTSSLEVTRTIPSRGYILESAASLFGFTGTVDGGYITAEVIEGDGAVGFELIRLPERDTIIGLNAAVPEVATELYSAQLAHGAGWFTAIKLVNSSTQARTATFTAVNNEGQVFAGPVSYQLPAGVVLEQDIARVFGWAAGTTALGTLRIQADGTGVLGDVIFGDAASLAYAAALPLQARTFTEAVFSQVANGAGYYTGLALHNPGTQAADITIEVFSSDGKKTGEGLQSMSGGARLAMLLTQLVPSTEGQMGGYVRIRSDRELIAQALFGNAQSLSAVPPAVVR